MLIPSKLIYQAIIMAICVIAGMLLCKSCHKPSSTEYIKGENDTLIITHDTTVVRDSLIPVHVYYTDTIHDSVLVPASLVDTRIYEDSILDGRSKTVVRDSIQGLLLGRSMSMSHADWTITRVDTLLKVIQPNGLFLEPAVTYDPLSRQYKVGVGASLYLKNYSLGYSFDGSHQVRVGVRIK